MIDLARVEPTHPSVEPSFEGDWLSVEFQPEPHVPQRFVIGAALARRGRLLAWRLASEAPRLACFYGDRFAKSTWKWLHDELEADLRAAEHTPVKAFQCRSPQISLTLGGFASGGTLDATLSRTFERIVTVVAHNKAKPRSEGVPQAELRRAVADWLMQRRPLEFARFAHPLGLLIRQGGEDHSFDIGYDDGAVAASVVSASYASLDNARLNVMTATADLLRYTRIRPRRQIGLAVLLPGSGLPGEVRTAWSDWWRHESYKYRESGAFVLMESDEQEALASQVSDLYPEPAA